MRLWLLVVIVCTQVFGLPKESLVQGGLIVVKLDSHESTSPVLINGKRVSVVQDGTARYALLGIPLDFKEPTQTFEMTYGEKRKKMMYEIAQKKYEEQHLTIANKRKVNPNADDMKRIESERSRKHKAKGAWSDTVGHAEYVWPVTGRISSVFGLRRFFNGQERRPHSGLDIAAKEGTPVVAMANGKVVEAGNFFFSGNVIFIEHGQGIVSLYAHLSRIDVKVGQMVKKGELIGAVGQTGRVTGPHLHLSVLVNRISVDPLLFLPDAEQKKNADHSGRM
jgi:murein DD-endopeptidase MepM/ murein hydrolase activator NlpD